MVNAFKAHIFKRPLYMVTVYMKDTQAQSLENAFSLQDAFKVLCMVT